MCGICGVLSFDHHPADIENIIANMMDKIQHRGPDDAGSYCNQHIAFGFRRLSIIDIDGGHQPMHNETQSVWGMLNGEIYNYLELRHRLQQKGHKFYSSSDTETIIHAYEEYGPKFVEYLRGMFAIAIWDTESRRLLLARDRIGKKPLYYFQTSGQFVFASELKAFLSWPEFDRDVDLSAVRDYLRLLFVPAPYSIFAYVRKLMPGHMLICDTDTGKFNLHKYWSFHLHPNHALTKVKFAEILRKDLEEAVSIRERSDVPLGAFLSGGLDSSSIAAIMARNEKSLRPKTFSVRFEQDRFDESSYARLVANHIGSEHHEEKVIPVTTEELERIVWYQDEPFGDSSAVPTYLLCQATRRHVTVALSGDGGDELFAGYRRYHYFRWIERLSLMPLALRRQLDSGLQLGMKHLPARRLQQMARAVKTSLSPPELRPFLLNQYFDMQGLKELFINDISLVPSLEARWEQQVEHLRFDDDLDLFLYLDTLIRLPDDMLVKVDRMSMAHGLEVRCPLLDQEIVQLAGHIPVDLKFHNGESKYILKRAVGDLLPPKILKRQKMGFDPPLGDWLKTIFCDVVIDCLSAESTQKRGWFRPEPVTAIRDALLSSKPMPYSEHQLWHRVWALLILELWARQYLDA